MPVSAGRGRDLQAADYELIYLGFRERRRAPTPPDSEPPNQAKKVTDSKDTEDDVSLRESAECTVRDRQHRKTRNRVHDDPDDIRPQHLVHSRPLCPVFSGTQTV